MINRHYIWDKKTVHTVIWVVVAVLVLVGTFTIELMSDIVQDNKKLERDLNATIYDYNDLVQSGTCPDRMPKYEEVVG